MGLRGPYENRGRFVKMQQRVGQRVKGEADAAEFAAEEFEDGLEFGAPGLRMVGDAEVGRLPDRLVKTEAGRAPAQDVGVDALGKHAAEKERVVGRVDAQDEGLFRRAMAGLRHEIGDVCKAPRGGIWLPRPTGRPRRAQLADVRKPSSTAAT